MTIEIIGAFESTYQPGHDVDIFESTRHVDMREHDLVLLHGCGVRRLRYPVRWHRVEPEPGRFDWDETDAVFDYLRSFGWKPIVDLVHHTSYPVWLTHGFADGSFPNAYLRFVESVFERYPWVEEYTLFNEPFATLFLCGHEAIWPPYGVGMADFVRLMRNVLPVIGEASRRCAAALPRARHLHCDTAEHHTGSGRGVAYAEYANDRRFFVLDALLGDDAPELTTDRPFVRDVLRHGGGDLLDLEPAVVDEVGLDYYAHSQWHFGDLGGRTPGPWPMPLADLIERYAERYRRTVWIGETNVRGYPSDRATWLKYTLEQCEVAVARGVDVRGFCWFPVVDSCDWDSLLRRCRANIDPVGVFGIDANGARTASTMSEAYTQAAGGAGAASLPAYRFAEPVASWLNGWLSHVPHWTWVDPPDSEFEVTNVPGDVEFAPLTIKRTK